MSKNIAFVPARSGSKRLKDKNVRILYKKPLVVWSLEACINSYKIDEVVFSTDSKDYVDLVKSFIDSPKLRIHMRSNVEAGDNIKIFDYLKENAGKIFGTEEGRFIMALPTMPLRNETHIDQALKLSDDFAKPVFSAVEYDFPVSFAFEITEEKAWAPMISNSPMLTGNTRSQDQKKMYHPNGAIYIRSIKDLNAPSLKTIYQGAIPMIMDKLESVDIDTMDDFVFAETLMKNVIKSSRSVS